jgi:uncharacterized membrane protein YphA (DoxX/SURF4 family)
MSTAVAVHTRVASDPIYQGYQILHIGFTIAPIVAGIDKFLHLLTNWDSYVAPAMARMLPVSVHGFMLAVGVVEIIAGVLVAIKPRIGAYIVALWLLCIIINLLALSGYYDVALRDFGLLLGALALGRMSMVFDK